MGGIGIVSTKNCSYGVEICSFFIVKKFQWFFRWNFFRPNCSNTPLDKRNCKSCPLKKMFWEISQSSKENTCNAVIFILKITAPKTKFSIKDFLSKCDQICKKLPIWSHLMKKPLREASFYMHQYMFKMYLKSTKRLQFNINIQFQKIGIILSEHNVCWVSAIYIMLLVKCFSL